MNQMSANHNKNVRILYGTPIDKQIEDFKKQMLNQGYKVTVVIEEGCVQPKTK